MAQIPCPECKRQISETAESCPKCGNKLTAEAVTMAKKRQRDFQIGCLVVFAIFVIIPILAIFTSSQQSTTSPPQPGRTKRLTGTSTYSYPASRPTPRAQQEQSTGHKEWLGTWSLESMGGQPTALNLAGSLKSDIFISWNYTFYENGRFVSKLLQDTGKGIRGIQEKHYEQ